MQFFGMNRVEGISNFVINYIFSNGILVKWSLTEKVSEKIKLFSCGMIDCNTIALGCSDSSIIIYELQNWSFSRKRISNGFLSAFERVDFAKSGIVWKILTAYSEGFLGNSEMFLCFGGLAEIDNDGAGTQSLGQYFTRIKKMAIKLCFTVSLRFIFDTRSNHEFTVEDNYFHFNYSKIDVKILYSIDFQILPTTIVKNLSKTIADCYDNFNCGFDKFYNCAILLIVGCAQGVIKTININSDKSFTQTCVKNPIPGASELFLILVLQCIINFSSNVKVNLKIIPKISPSHAPHFKNLRMKIVIYIRYFVILTMNRLYP
ncbi:hypothetical protein MXB_5709 [Myxobolus squamalis]|nr:hypothetical protein MXB_5709 [Myxobolus squamalis]